MLTLIENGDVYAPRRLGRTSILLAGDRVLRIGSVDRAALDRLGASYEIIDAEGRLVTPGLIDPHEHLLGGSGEEGFSSQTPAIRLGEIIAAGITTVVGCLGVDTSMKTLAGLLGRAKGLAEEGLTTFIYTGGYNVPPTTMLGTVRNDIMFITEVIGSGEIAIADERSTDPDPHELARLVSDTHIAGMLSNKAGVTHFHVGPEERRLAPLRSLIDDYDVRAEWLYPTHVGRSKKLLAEAVRLTRQGSTVDIDTVENDLAKWLAQYVESGADLEHLTISTDAAITGPHHLLGQMRDCVLEHGFTLEQVLPLATANTARVLRLPTKGRLEEGCDADVLVLAKDSLEIEEVVTRGRRVFQDGCLTAVERFVPKSDRDFNTTAQQREFASK